MGLFDSFKKVVKATVDTAILPIETAKDLVTGDLIFDDDPDSAQRVRKIKDRLQEAYENIDD